MKTRYQRAEHAAGEGPGLALLADLYRENDALAALQNNSVSADIRSFCARHLQAGCADEELLAGLVGRVLTFDASVPFSTRTVVFVGPHGVGKTTTIAKLAIRLQAALEMRIGIVAWQTGCISSNEDLSRLSESFHVSVETVDESLPMDTRIPQAIARLERCDLLFIDAPGVEVGRESDLSRVGELLASCGEAETLLTLPAHWKECDLRRAAEFFDRLGASRVVISQMDRVGRMGPLINALHTVGLPIGFFSAGSRIPEDIEPASARRLAWMLLRRMH